MWKSKSYKIFEWSKSQQSQQIEEMKKDKTTKISNSKEASTISYYPI